MTATTETPVYPCTCRPGCPETMPTPSGEGRGWATPCYRRWERADRPDSGPPPPRPAAGPKAHATKAEAEALLAEFTRLRAQGLTVAAIAERMGLHLRAAEHYAKLWRQQQRDGAMDAEITWPVPSSPLPGVSHWSGAAACRGHQDLFYDPEGPESQRAKEIRESKARSLCAACPVRLQCMEDALARGEKRGTWGGFTEDGRARLERERKNASRRVAARREQDGVAA